MIRVYLNSPATVLQSLLLPADNHKCPSQIAVRFSVVGVNFKGLLKADNCVLILLLATKCSSEVTVAIGIVGINFYGFAVALLSLSVSLGIEMLNSFV